MRHLPAFCLSLFLALLVSVNTVNAGKISVDDLLNPGSSLKNDKTEGNQQLAGIPKKDMNIDDLLGPKDNFPFLPDNHRDSGTGKFNSF